MGSALSTALGIDRSPWRRLCQHEVRRSSPHPPLLQLALQDGWAVALLFPSGAETFLAKTPKEHHRWFLRVSIKDCGAA